MEQMGYHDWFHLFKFFVPGVKHLLDDVESRERHSTFIFLQLFPLLGVGNSKHFRANVDRASLNGWHDPAEAVRLYREKEKE